MSLVVKVDGVTLTTVQPSSVEAVTMADQGQAGFGGILLDDATAAQNIVGHKLVTIEETSCSQPRIFTGWTTSRDVSRSLERGMFVGEDARIWDGTLVDSNALFSFRTIRGGTGAGNRPEEAFTDRLAWIIGSNFLNDLVADLGEVFTPAVDPTMDAADYRGQHPADVLGDLMQRKPDRLTYFSYWSPADSELGIFVNKKGAATWDSTLSISNDPADVDNITTFAPFVDAVLKRSPETVYSDVMVRYANGRVFRHRPSTADQLRPARHHGRSPEHQAEVHGRGMGRGVSRPPRPGAGHRHRHHPGAGRQGWAGHGRAAHEHQAHA